MTELLKTPLYSAHQQLSAKIVDFGGWALPVNYGSQIEEHHAVRNNCGVFDVSHMTVTDISGEDSIAFLSKLLANDVRALVGQPGKALYSCMLNETGGVIDDLIIYYLDDSYWRLVTNASTNTKDMAWLNQQSQPYNVTISERPELALIAIQGPHAITKSIDIFDDSLATTIKALKRFQGAFANRENELFVGRTGYTGEDGLELIVPKSTAQEIWTKIIDANVQACGLGARDTLRLEAGMALYGSDLDEQHTPNESGLAWTVKSKDEREFIGKSACLAPAKFKMIGLELLDKGVLRGHQKIHLDGTEVGEVTSGTFSPTLEKSIALARVTTSTATTPNQRVEIAIRKKLLQAKIVDYPFIKFS